MTKKEAINYLQQIYPNGGHCWLDEKRIEAINMAIEALREEPAHCTGIGEPKEESGVLGEMIKEMKEEPKDHCKDLNEEPVSEDIEAAARESAKVERSDDTEVGYDINKYEGFVEGAVWQREKNKNLPKIWPRDTIEEYAYQVAYDLSNDWARDYPEWEDVETACKLGAEWQEKQMMKEE